MARVRKDGAGRWVQRASMAREAYTTGIENPRRDWAESTKAAEDTWKAGVQQAAAEGRFSKGVIASGSAYQKSRALEVGADRFVTGVSVAKAKYEAGIAPYLTVIEQTTLPPRYPRGDARNLERVKTITQALRNKKVTMLKTGTK
jgi:hypothetical protein